MQLRRVEIIKYRNFENVVIDFEKSDFPNVFSIASKNGGGKSTLLQFIFIMLHCIVDEDRHSYMENILEKRINNISLYDELLAQDKIINNEEVHISLINFIFEEKKNKYNLNLELWSMNSDNIIVLKTNISTEQLIKLSNSIYLTVPDAQPLHFLSEKDDKEEMRKNLPNFSTYEFPTEKSILNSFEHEKQEDFREMRVHGRYGSNYIDFQNELKDFIEGKEIGENQEGTKITFKLKGFNKALLSEDLSHGELRKLGIYIWLKSMVQKDAIVLMDEVDIALHPKWQYELVNDLTEWSKGSQFLLATHSPQILSATYYKNLIILKDNKVKQLSKPLRDNDINHIVELVMGASPLPLELDKQHKLYRALVEEGKESSKEAQEIKDMILEQEGIGSSFFRRIEFYKKMNKK
jgi:predicted ATP-binding protein involved in virulence